MKFLLLGGSGFIGSRLAQVLSSAHHDVTIIGHEKKISLPNVNYIQLDFTHCSDFTEYIKDSDVIVHLVSTIIPTDNLSKVNQEISDNVFPTTILLNNITKLKKKIIFISSGGTVYGNNASANLESGPTNPICNYGISKLLIEKYLYLYHHFYNIDYRIIRLSNPYSENVFHGKKQGVIPIIIDNIINDTTIEIWGDHQTRDYIHIDDVMRGIVDIINYKGEERIFNLGSGSSHTIDDIISIASKKLNKTPSLVYRPTRKCDVQDNVLDINLINRETGWTPNISLEEGIDKIINIKKEA